MEKNQCTADEYLNKIVVSLKKIKDCSKVKEKHFFNSTEMRLIGEIIANNVEGKQVISTELAKSLGVTRSAISQMVNRMEEKGVVKRVACKYDRKKFYIELSESTRERYEKERTNLCGNLDKVVEIMGREDMDQLIRLIDRFIECQRQVIEQRS